MNRLAGLVLATAALSLTACVGVGLKSTEMQNLLRSRASVDLDCAASLLKVEPAKDNSSLVSGCGKQAVYTFPEGGNDWKRFGDVTNAGAEVKTPTRNEPGF